MALQQSKARYEAWSDGQHNPQAANHAATVLTQIEGFSARLLKWGSDDPALFAYQLREHLPKLQAYVNDLKMWSEWVIQADPDTVPPVGAK